MVDTLMGSDNLFDQFDKRGFKEEVERAIKYNEFQLYYQPQIYVKNLRLFGAEALIRWHHPIYGVIFPGAFIPRAEKEGLIIDIGCWVKRHCLNSNGNGKVKGLTLLISLSTSHQNISNIHAF